MRIAIVSDIHGNRTAFEAVLADLRQTSPDLVLHGGDLADSGSGCTDVIDQIRALSWPGVVGNTDEMLTTPQSLEEFASKSPHLEYLFSAIRDIAAWTREVLGNERLGWLRDLPRVQKHGPMVLVHASPATAWLAPTPDASDDELTSIYGPLGQPIAVYAHIHRHYVRRIAGMVIANTGSVSLPYNGDPRASYLLLDGSEPVIRHVEYNVQAEISALKNCGLPHAAWIARMLESGSFQMP